MHTIGTLRYSSHNLEPNYQDSMAVASQCTIPARHPSAPSQRTIPARYPSALSQRTIPAHHPSALSPYPKCKAERNTQLGLGSPVHEIRGLVKARARDSGFSENRRLNWAILHEIQGLVNAKPRISNTAARDLRFSESRGPIGDPRPGVSPGRERKSALFFH